MPTQSEFERRDDAVRVVIVDFGNVLFSIDFLRTVHALAKLPGYNGLPIQFGVDEQDELFFSVDRGDVMPDEFRSELRSRFGFTCTDDEITRAWCSILIAPFPFYRKVISDLRGRFVGARVVMLSNISELHLEQSMRTTSELFPSSDSESDSLLDAYYFSCRIRHRKPSPEAFQYVCDAEHVSAEQCVLFDDSSANCSAAQALGMLVSRVTPGDPDLAFRELQGA